MLLSFPLPNIYEYILERDMEKIWIYVYLHIHI